MRRNVSKTVYIKPDRSGRKLRWKFELRISESLMPESEDEVGGYLGSWNVEQGGFRALDDAWAAARHLREHIADCFGMVSDE